MFQVNDSRLWIFESEGKVKVKNTSDCPVRLEFRLAYPPTGPYDKWTDIVSQPGGPMVIPAGETRALSDYTAKTAMRVRISDAPTVDDIERWIKAGDRRGRFWLAKLHSLTAANLREEERFYRGMADVLKKKA